MNWEAIYMDPMTYIVVFAASWILAVPTFKPFFKNIKVPQYSGKKDYSEAYAPAIILLVLAPVTVPGWILIYWFIWRCLFKPAAEAILPDHAKIPKER